MIRLGLADVAPAAEMLVCAFQNDPLPAYLLPDEATRKRGAAHCLGAIVRYGLRFGEVYATSAKLEGVSVWLPPAETKATLGKMLRAGVLALPARTGWACTLRFWRLQRHLARVWQRFGDFPHWYLCLLGVNPHCQGQGSGKSLVRAMLERFDRDRVPCCVDTVNERNTEFYRSLGYSVVHAAPVPKTDLNCWFLLRQPAAAAGG